MQIIWHNKAKQDLDKTLGMLQSKVLKMRLWC